LRDFFSLRRPGSTHLEARTPRPPGAYRGGRWFPAFRRERPAAGPFY